MPRVNGIRWQPPGFSGDNHVLADIRRGFIESIRIDWLRWRNQHERLRKAAPICRVELTDVPRIFEIQGKVQLRDYSKYYPVIDGERPAQTAKRLCELEWPGIEFDVPELGNWSQSSTSPAEALRRARERILTETGGVASR